jgi:hypothetical protein
VQSLRSLVVLLFVGSAGVGVGARVADGTECPRTCETSIGYSLDARFDDDERGAIAQAARAWERGSGGRVCFHTGGQDVQFIRVDTQEDLRPVDPEWSRHVALTKGKKIWIVPSKVEDHGEYVALAIHELGHFLGLSHVEDTRETYMHQIIDDTPDDLRKDPQIPPRDRRELCRARGCVCAF